MSPCATPLPTSVPLEDGDLDNHVERLTDRWLALDASRIGSSGKTERGGDIIPGFVIRGPLD